MPSQQQQKVSAFFVARLVGEIGFIIAVPLAGLVLAGHWLDTKLGYQAVFIFIGMMLALLTSSIIIYLKIKFLSYQ